MSIVYWLILFPIKLPYLSFFYITPLEVVFATSISVFVAVYINLFTIFITKWQNENDKKSYLWMYFLSPGWVECVIYNYYRMINVLLALSSISRGLLLWSINHALINKTSVLVVFDIVNQWGDKVISCQNCLWAQMWILPLILVDNHYWRYNALVLLQMYSPTSI